MRPRASGSRVVDNAGQPHVDVNRESTQESVKRILLLGFLGTSKIDMCILVFVMSSINGIGRNYLGCSPPCNAREHFSVQKRNERWECTSFFEHIFCESWDSGVFRFRG